MTIFKCDICKKEVEQKDLHFIKFSNHKLALVEKNKEVCPECLQSIFMAIEDEIRFKEEENDN